MAARYPKHPNYVPIVKWQTWEREAFKHTEPAVAAHVLPCFEVRLPEQHTHMLKSLTATWSHAALIDYANPEGRLTSSRASELNEFLAKRQAGAAPVSPVLNPLDVGGLSSALKKSLAKHPITLRVRPSSLVETAALTSEIEQAWTAIDNFSAARRLIVDLGRTPAQVTNAESLALAKALRDFKSMGFEEIHLASGSFPESLQDIAQAKEILRRDWALWQKVDANDPTLLIGFSDYGPLTPLWTEEVLMRRGGRSCIRYALDSKWLVIRGSGNKRADSIAISELMVNLYAADFKGASFSYGDKLIAERADPSVPPDKKKCGQAHIAEYWSHHVAHVVKQQY